MDLSLEFLNIFPVTMVRSSALKRFFKTWRVREHRVSAAYHPHSNLRAETAVKSAKRVLMDNTRSDGSPDQDKMLRAIMQHRNTPDSEYGLSPAQLVFGRPIKDFLPIKPGHFSPSEVWVDCREKRELAMKARFSRGLERWSEHTRNLAPLSVGQRVLLQNQYGAGKTAKRWDRSGTVLESLGYNKYRIRVDGSGRVTDRNRQFLRQFSNVTLTEPGSSSPTSQTPPQPAVTAAPPQPAVTAPPEPAVTTAPDLPTTPPPPPSPAEEDSFETPPSSPQAEPVPSAESTTPALRRSGRNVVPNQLFPPSNYDLQRKRSWQ